jgi:hypothetical protein
MALAFQRLLTPTAGPRATAPTGEAPSRLQVAVVFTSPAATIGALHRAGALADRLSARIELVVPQVVPFALPIASPPVLLEFSERQFVEIAKETPVETAVQIYLCRDRLDTLLSVLKPGSLVVIGGRKRWWPTSEWRLARSLSHAGHEVIYTETE